MKNYIKPSISFQFLNLSSSVSGGCFVSANQGEFVCPVEIPDMGGDTVFSDRNCTYEVESPEEWELCYHNPSDTARILGS